jgi:hypothetical protein
MANTTDIAVQQQQHATALRVMHKRTKRLEALTAQMAQALDEISSRPRTVTEEIDSIPGRRIETIFSGEIDFDASDANTRGAPVIILISQDGPFIMTHYPMILWYPTAPDDATNLNAWRPVSSFPLPTQEVSGDIIDLKYEINDGGAQRMFQNEPRGPVISRPDNIIPCAVPTEFAPGATINIVPTYMRFLWNGGGGEGQVAPTAGILHVDLIGYRCVNL